MRTAQFWQVFVVAVLVNPRLYFLLNWLPTYFSQQWDEPPAGRKGILTLIFHGLDLGIGFVEAASLASPDVDGGSPQLGRWSSRSERSC